MQPASRRPVQPAQRTTRKTLLKIPRMSTPIRASPSPQSSNVPCVADTDTATDAQEPAQQGRQGCAGPMRAGDRDGRRHHLNGLRRSGLLRGPATCSNRSMLSWLDANSNLRKAIAHERSLATGHEEPGTPGLHSVTQMRKRSEAVRLMRR
jgi:hypothetical protein